MCQIYLFNNFSDKQRKEICHTRKMLDSQLLHIHIYITVLDMSNLPVQTLFSQREEGD